MRKGLLMFFAFCVLSICLLSMLFFSIKAGADIVSAESSRLVTVEVSSLLTSEAKPAITGEATSLSSSEAKPATTNEAAALLSSEAGSLITLEATAPSSIEASPPSAEAPAANAEPEEGTSYKEVSWGTDFETFKAIKHFTGNLGPLSASFVGSIHDNDIALMLGVPLSQKGKSGEQRVLFEYVPRKFASVYFEPDDTEYIFYDRKFAVTFSVIDENNWDLYCDTFYKKYQKINGFTRKYNSAGKKSYQIYTIVFEKGRTTAFLIKSQLKIKKTTSVSAKVIFASTELLDTIRREINDKIAAEKMTSGKKSKQKLEKDLNKIE